MQIKFSTVPRQSGILARVHPDRMDGQLEVEIERRFTP
jgi:hypothetical protein